FQSRVFFQVSLIKHYLLVIAAQPAEAALLGIAKSKKITRNFADSINVIRLRNRLGAQPAIWSRIYKKLLDNLRNKPALPCLNTLADHGRKIELLLRKSFECRLGNLAKF